MSPDKQKSIDTMRTYARDVAREKGEPIESKPEPEKDIPKPPTKAPVKKENIVAKKAEDEPVVAAKKPEPRQVKSPDRTPKQIPPFHELQKAVKTDIKAEAEPEKKASKKEGIKPTKPVAGGTVITDNKNARPSFIAELQKSFSSWMDSVKKAFQPKKKNAYAVTQTERRRGVVQKATSKTGTIFTADNETLREQIKARQRAEKHEHDDLSWSPYTEPGYPLLDGNHIESSDPRITKVSVTQKTHTLPKPVIKSTEKIPELQEKTETDDELMGVPVPEPKKEGVPSEVTEEIPESETQESSDSKSGELLSDGQEPDDVETDEDAEVVEEEKWNLEDVSLKDTNTLAMLLVGVVLGIGIIGFVIFGIFGVGNDDGGTARTEPVETAMFTGGPLGQITLTEVTFNELVSAINSTIIEKPSDTTVEYKFVDSNNNNLPSDTTMDLLRTRGMDEFSDTVRTVRFLHTSDSNRALLIESPDSQSALGGMLNWEDTLLADIGPVLDIFNVPPSAGSFTDTPVSDLDARSLLFDGETIVIYAVLDETNVIIATDASVLETYSQK